MKKYIITPVLLTIACMVMCHCTFNRKASVAANEYLIQGELANLPDSIVIGLYEEDGSILNCVWRDTLMNGQFSFRDTVSTTRKMLIMSDNRGFPGTWLEVWRIHRNQGAGQTSENMGSSKRCAGTAGRKPLYGLRDGPTERTDAAHGGRI